MLEACGHSPHRDQPDATLAAIERFVAHVSLGRP
jgi:pimeloyl-ACP methyl ester carboxylesterase